MNKEDFKIRLLNIQDYDTWIRFAGEVEPLFGPMVDSKDFQDGVKQCIQEKNAYGIENSNRDLAGIIAVDREKNEIIWLAVGQIFRGHSYGDKLVKKAIEELESKGDIYVQTFSEDAEYGRSAREIYRKNGFIDQKDAGNNPAGIETVIMIKHKTRQPL